MVELTEVMRQRGDFEFISLLRLGKEKLMTMLKIL